MKIIKFHQEMCGPCKMVANHISVTGQKVDQEIDVYNATGEERELVTKHQIMQVPVLILVDEDGNEIDKVRGFNPPQIDELFKKRNQ